MKHQTAINMRAFFAKSIHDAMKTNKDIVVVVGDLGYKMWDAVRKDFPDRFINVGAAEQTLMGVAIGLALEGKIPVVYSITSFLLYRPFETIRNYINHEKIPVLLIGSGRDKDYAHDGISHWAEEDRDIMKILKHINAYWPTDEKEVTKLLTKMLKGDKPYYINLKR